jgi:hypothetical protein
VHFFFASPSEETALTQVHVHSNANHEKFAVLYAAQEDIIRGLWVEIMQAQAELDVHTLLEHQSLSRAKELFRS